LEQTKKTLKVPSTGMGERDIIKVLELVKHNELERLQGKVHTLKIRYLCPWVQKTGGMTYMNQEQRMLQAPSSYNGTNLYPLPKANWYSHDFCKGVPIIHINPRCRCSEVNQQ
jgi:hypothetical protein